MGDELPFLSRTRTEEYFVPKPSLLILVIWILLPVLWSLPAFPQDSLLWCRTYGGNTLDYAITIQQTTDEGYVTAGYTNSFGAGGEDVFVIKTSANGSMCWSRTYGGSEDDRGRSIQQTEDGGYILAGVTGYGFTGWGDVYLVKIDSAGDILWSRSYGGSHLEEAYSVRQTADRGYIVAGVTGSFGPGGSGVYLTKTDSLGETLWSRTYGGGSYEFGYSVQQTRDGGYIVTGRTASFGAGDFDVYLIRTDSTGDTLWTRTYGGSGYDDGFFVEQTTDGGYIIVGETQSFGAGDGDIYLVKTDSLGNAIWSRAYGGSGRDWGSSVHETAYGGYILTGVTESFGAGYEDVLVIKTQADGGVCWGRHYGGSHNDLGRSLQQTTDGGYIVAGMTWSFGAGDFDLMLTKLDSLGNACIGSFLTPIVTSTSPTVTNPVTQLTSPSPVITSPTDAVTSPPTQVTIVCVAVRGEANGDGIIDLGDLVYLIGYLYRGGPAPNPMWVGDCNCDEVVDVGDVVFLINYLYRAGDPPNC